MLIKINGSNILLNIQNNSSYQKFVEHELNQQEILDLLDTIVQDSYLLSGTKVGYIKRILDFLYFLETEQPKKQAIVDIINSIMTTNLESSLNKLKSAYNIPKKSNQVYSFDNLNNNNSYDNGQSVNENSNTFIAKVKAISSTYSFYDMGETKLILKQLLHVLNDFITTVSLLDNPYVNQYYLNLYNALIASQQRLTYADLLKIQHY